MYTDIMHWICSSVCYTGFIRVVCFQLMGSAPSITRHQLVVQAVKEKALKSVTPDDLDKLGVLFDQDRIVRVLLNYQY